MLVIACLGAWSSSCFETASGTRGELGTGGFSYVCTGWGDPVCTERFSGDGTAGQSSTIEMPLAIAVGGRFGVRFESDDPNDFDPRTVSAVSPDLLETRTVGYQALEHGWVGLLARDGVGNVVDLTHVQVVEPTRLVVIGSTTSLSVGDSEPLRGEVRDRDGLQLAGALDYDWSVDDEAVARVVAAQADPDAIYDDIVSLEAIAPGEATLTVTAGGLTQTVDIVVAE